MLVSVLNGVAIGFLLFVLAVGLSLVFGMMDVLNLAHGALFLGGAYLAATLAGRGWPGFLAALALAAAVGLAAGALLSLMTEPLRRRSHLDQALLTLGVALVVSEVLIIIFGDDPLAVPPPPGLDGSISVFGAVYPTYRLMIIGVGAALALLVYLVVERTRVGALVRATVADREMVAAIGVDNRLVKAAVFAIGSLLATTAGVLGGPIYGARPGLDATVLILALVVVVIGGLGSVRGALVGALLIGQIDTLGRVLLPELASFILFAALALVLVLRPRGLFGGPVAAAGGAVTTVQAPAVPGGAPATAPRGRIGVLCATVVLLLLAGVPLVLAPFATTTLTRILVFALFAVSLDLLVGVTGLPSLGHAGYFGAGAYAAGWVSINVTADAPVPLLAGLAAGALTAALTGWITVRSHGVFFLMLTLAIGETLQQVADSWESVTGGANGLTGVPAVRLAGQPLANAGYVYWYVLAVGAIGFGAVWVVARSPFGTALRGIRDNEPRMRALGYATAWAKYAVFVIAGGVAGLAGSLLIAQQRLVTPADLGFATASLALLAVIIGGAGSLWGACLGAALVVLIRDAIGPSLDGHGTLVLGLVFVLVVYLFPRGAAGLRLPGWRRSR